ncbi:phosphoribosylglycinamide synthetase [Bifidobacterium aemilianum]|uniref:phosphoribosylglycinamide synthetase n=1 Tax=Bifidobacterium aemilianum TaxID=2493120 RepID=UPI001F170892|nr:phosphoribosylglycinamide synthetase [Bifidobacterium aemilianum]
MDLQDPTLSLTVASQRLSIVRYVFLVQIEDGIASAEQRAALEYADTVLIGWPDADSPEVTTLEVGDLAKAGELMSAMEGYIDRFSQAEMNADIDGMTDSLVRISERVAQVRRLYQPEFLLPTYAEIRRVVQAEWDEDMGRIEPPAADAALEAMEEETEEADEGRAESAGHHQPSGPGWKGTQGVQASGSGLEHSGGKQ